MYKILFSLLILFATTACTINRPVSNDYDQYLANNIGTSNLPKANQSASYEMSKAIQSHRYEFRSFMTGSANLWIVEFGKMLDATLKSKDVQAAFNNQLSELNGENPQGSLIYFDLQNYQFIDKQAKIALKVTLKQKENVLFTKVYTANGNSQGGKMFWGGAFAQKNAVQQSTKVALDIILKQLIYDFNQSVK
ncbi:hypothetical protein [Pleionea sediminis]|uniref:hypothetical protein n=1 Tax=Pleionea sediminis TaxID=2569479 RepID=UPI0011861906|nr:hypothetical protein [Pleionea sediminis]